MALVKHSPASAQADACDLCPYLSTMYTELSMERIAEIMHEPCQDCLSFDDSSQHLCSICQHLRLRHLFNCLLKVGPYQDPNRKFRISFAPWYRFNLSNGCTLCDMFRRTSEMHAKYQTNKAAIDAYPNLDIYCSKNYRQKLIVVKESHGIYVFNPVEAPHYVQTSIQWSLVNNWLVTCTEKHSMCHSQYFTHPDEILLVDVQRRRLVRANGNCKFVALSYVWGVNRNPERLICKKSNVEGLKKDGALKAEQLPRTIEDALQVCKNLGQKYLWTDRLCIVQDDPSQKHEQIEAMAKVYSSAYLVIVVLDGDMETGIPGLQPRPMQKQVKIDRLVYISQLPYPVKLIEHSNWATRCWTYQEAVLARRKLYFSRVQAFFECNRNIREEDQTTSGPVIERRALYLAEDGWSLQTWQDHLSTYTSRSLSYPSDIYNAIAGISNALLPEPSSCLYGLPRRNFGQALLWNNNLEEGYRYLEKRDRGPNRILLPRWSWSSVNGQIRHRIHPDYDVAYAGTSVVWKHREEICGFPTFVPVRDSKFAADDAPTDAYCIYSEYDPSRLGNPFITVGIGSSSNFPKVYAALEHAASSKLLCFGIAWSQGCIDAKWPFHALTKCTFLELGVELEKRWQNVDFVQRDVLFAPQEQQTPMAGIEMSLDRSTLKGRAQTSFFALKEDGITEETQNFFTIVDHEGRPAGQIDKIENLKARVNLTFSPSCMYQLIALGIGFFTQPEDIHYMYGDFLAHDPVAGHLWESVWRYNDWIRVQENISRFCEAVGPNGLDISYLDSEGSALGFIPVVHVMLAEWDGPVARRISIGWVFLTRWVKSNPQFKTVYLA